jgi:hypothetical protein
MKKYTCEIIQDGDEQLLQFTDEFCKENNWQTDDTISFDVDADNVVSIINLSKRERDESLYRAI